MTKQLLVFLFCALVLSTSMMVLGQISSQVPIDTSLSLHSALGSGPVSVLRMSLRDKNTRKKLAGTFIIKSAQENKFKTLLAPNGLQQLTFHEAERLEIEARVTGYQTISRKFQILVTSLGKAYEFEALLEKETFQIRLNALDFVSKQLLKKPTYFIRNTHTDDLQKIRPVKAQPLTYLSLNDNIRHFAIECVADGYQPQTIRLDSSHNNTTVSFLLRPIQKASTVVAIYAQDFLTKDIVPFSLNREPLKLVDETPFKVLLIEGEDLHIDLKASGYEPFKQSYFIGDSLLNQKQLIFGLQRKTYTFILKAWGENPNRELNNAQFKIINLDNKESMPVSLQGLYPIVELLPYEQYAIQIKAEGYEPYYARFVPLNMIKSKVFQQDFYLKKKKIVVAHTPTNDIIASQQFGIIEQGKTIPLNNIYFDQSSPILREESFKELDYLVQLLVENPNLRIEIRGHTDNVGDFNLNLKLSQDRCWAVINYLTTKGIAVSRLEAVGRGPLDPIAPNNSEEQKKKNRRVEFIRL